MAIAKTPFSKSSKQAPLDELDSLLEEDWSEESAVTIVIENNIPNAARPEPSTLKRYLPVVTLILVALIEIARELDFFLPDK